MASFSGHSPSKLTLEELIERFLDSRHRKVAHLNFPRSPWRQYCKPFGEYPSQGWTFFKKSYERAWRVANRPRVSLKQRVLSNKLTLDLLIELNSLMIFGKKLPMRKVVRQSSIVYRFVPSTHLQTVFSKRGVKYRNPDGLKLEVEGFLTDKKSEFIFCYYLEKINEANNPSQKRAWLFKLRRHLKRTIRGHEKWTLVCYLIGSKKIVSQLKAILDFYDRECQRIIQEIPLGTRSFERAVTTLALKMQRYIDITHLACDGTSRTSRLVEDFIYWQFGMCAPLPIPLNYEGWKLHRLTYTPLNKDLIRFKLPKARNSAKEKAAISF